MDKYSEIAELNQQFFFETAELNQQSYTEGEKETFFLKFTGANVIHLIRRYWLACEKKGSNLPKRSV